MVHDKSEKGRTARAKVMLVGKTHPGGLELRLGQRHIGELGGDARERSGDRIARFGLKWGTPDERGRYEIEFQ
jgi:hypothetical protein